MQQKTHDFLVRMRVPMATFGGDLMGEAIDFAIQEMRNNRFVTLTDIENVLSDRFHCSASSADARLRRACRISNIIQLFKPCHISPAPIDWHRDKLQ